MSLFSSIRASFAQGLAQNKIAELLKPYEIQVHSTEFRGKGWFRLVVDVPTWHPGAHSRVTLTGEVGFSVDQPRASLLDLRCDVRWLHVLADKHLVGRELPLTPEQVAQLRKLWP